MPDAASRPIYLVTVPVKDIGWAKRVLLQLLMLISRSNITWAMHWALKVDDSFFELQRIPTQPNPVLKVSQWSTKKQSEIVGKHFAGYTDKSDDEIKQAGQKHFDTVVPDQWYDVFVNSCQTFVDVVLTEISDDHDPDIRPRGIAFIIMRFVHGPFLLMTVMILHFRGCPDRLRSKYTHEVVYFSHYLLSRYSIMRIELTDQLSKEFNSARDPVLVVVLILYLLIIWVPTYLYQPWLAFPQIRRDKAGSWSIHNEFLIDSGKGDESIRPRGANFCNPKEVPFSVRLLGGMLAAGIWQCWIGYLVITVALRRTVLVALYGPGPY